MDFQQTNIMTIDVEDWYNSSLELFKDAAPEFGARPDPSVVDNTLYSLEILSQTNNKATFFVLGPVAEHYPDLIREMLLQGHEVASHGYAHRLIYKTSPQEFEDDLKCCFDHLARAGCLRVQGFRAPYWSITRNSLWALNIIEKLGCEYDSSIFPIRRGLYGIPDANPQVHQITEGLWEFPPATLRKLGVNLPIAGGGYLRLVPYAIIKAAIRKTADHQYRVFYFHPYELDPTDVHLKHQVKTAGTLAYWLQQIAGRRNNPNKLKKLLSQFSFTSIEHVLAQLKKSNAGSKP